MLHGLNPLVEGVPSSPGLVRTLFMFGETLALEGSAQPHSASGATQGTWLAGNFADWALVPEDPSSKQALPLGPSRLKVAFLGLGPASHGHRGSHVSRHC